MTEKMVDKAYELIDKFAKDGTVNNTISFYGGEPFLKKNSKIVKYILRKGLGKNLKFGAITNGYELEEFKEFFGKGKIEKIQITLDGPPKIHNNSRYLYDGTATFEKIAKNISLALSKKVAVSIRINVDKKSINELNELDDIFQNNGWKDSKYFSAYIALKRAYGLEDKCNTFSKEGDLAKEWIKIVNNSPNSKIGTVDQGIKKVFSDSIINNTVIRFKSSYCGANSSMYLFDPLGDIYTCWDVVKQKQCKVGEYFPEHKTNSASLNNWHVRHIGNIDQCTKCKYALFCGGGCEGQLYHDKEEFFSSYCNDFPNLFKKYLLHTLNTNKSIQVKLSNKLIS